MTLHRLPKSTAQAECQAEYSFAFAQKGAMPVIRQRLKEKNNLVVWAEITGFSPDESKVLVNFAYGAGDGWVNRPVIYDNKTGAVRVIPDATERLQKKFPHCDGVQYQSGVTNDGDVLFYVPRANDGALTECNTATYVRMSPKTKEFKVVSKAQFEELLAKKLQKR